MIHQAKGESAIAWQLVEAISQFDLEQRGGEDNRTRSLRARLFLLEGNREVAGNWIDSSTDPPPDQALMWLEEPQVTRALILLTRGTDADLRLARVILDVLDEITERTHNTRSRIEVLAMQAIALDAQGETSEAENTLKQTVDLSRPGGFIRIFVDLGKPMLELLGRLASQGQFVETIQRLLAAFPAEYSPPEDDENLLVNTSPARHPSPGNSRLAEPLTPRELEVLNLLRGPASIKEIALNLHISYATAKRHTINIYAKLGVNQRWDAVTKAEELHIF
jgi:LuxR family maltose regulon positive regulatory protein